MKAYKRITAFLLSMSVCLAGSAVNAIAADTENNSDIEIISLEPTKEMVDGFVEWFKYESGETENIISYDDFNCMFYHYGKDKLPNYTFLFKSALTGDSYLLVNGDGYKLGENNGGKGVISLATADTDNNGAYELYFTYSWDCGEYVSQAGYYDTASKEVIYFDKYACFGDNMNLADENGVLSLCTSDGKAAEIINNSGKIEFNKKSDAVKELDEKLTPLEKDSNLPEWIPKNFDDSYDMLTKDGNVIIKDGYACLLCYKPAESSFAEIAYIHDDTTAEMVSHFKYDTEFYDAMDAYCFRMLPNTEVKFSYYFNNFTIGNNTFKNDNDFRIMADESGNIVCEPENKTAEKQPAVGDANCDGECNIADAVAILQYLANSAKYPLSAQGLINADFDGDGITGADALAIQKMDAMK